jgi:hypothetical protein
MTLPVAAKSSELRPRHAGDPLPVIASLTERLQHKVLGNR